MSNQPETEALELTVSRLVELSRGMYPEEAQTLERIAVQIAKLYSEKEYWRGYAEGLEQGFQHA